MRLHSSEIMATKNNHQKRSPNGEKPIHVEFTHSTATTVAIAGSFNGWRPEPAQFVAKGKWAKELMLPPGRDAYLFVAEGNGWLTRLPRNRCLIRSAGSIHCSE